MSAYDITLAECVDDVQNSKFENTIHEGGALRRVVIKVTMPSMGDIKIHCTETDLKIAKAALLPPNITEESLKGSQKQLLGVIERGLGVFNLNLPLLTRPTLPIPPVFPDMRYHG